MSSFVIAVAAAACFTGGGLLMKPAAGLSRLGPTTAVFALFVLGAGLLAHLVHRGGEVGPAYVVVVGMEALLAFALGALFYGEQLTAARVLAVTLVLSGTIILAGTGV